jgi:hypothetical protein
MAHLLGAGERTRTRRKKGAYPHQELRSRVTHQIYEHENLQVTCEGKDAGMTPIVGLSVKTWRVKNGHKPRPVQT